jgi:heme exporter protein A
MSHYLEIDKLACIRGDRLLFQELSLQAGEGELVRVEGINGSGKTSLLRILSGLSRPSNGTVRWSGQDIQRDRAAYCAMLAYLGHSNGIKHDLTPYENLRVARSLANAPSNVDISDALAQLDLEGYEHLPSRQLSMGQQRRVALARLLVSDKTLWILDEPFTSLDSNGITLVENLLNAHAARGGISVLTTHHQLHGVKCRIIPLNLSWQA